MVPDAHWLLHQATACYILLSMVFGSGRTESCHRFDGPARQKQKDGTKIRYQLSIQNMVHTKFTILNIDSTTDWNRNREC